MGVVTPGVMWCLCQNFSAPGMFSASASMDGGVTFYPQLSWVDDSSPSLSLYTIVRVSPARRCSELPPPPPPGSSTTNRYTTDASCDVRTPGLLRRTSQVQSRCRWCTRYCTNTVGSSSAWRRLSECRCGCAHAQPNNPSAPAAFYQCADGIVV
jgi:hypothetical protein